jgi:phosphopantothenoylcysteine decarboxylase/phosphopantothenate--cysteine ligase
MARVLIGITGSIAAIKTINLIHILVQSGHQCKVIVTKDGLNFVTPISLAAMGAQVFIDDLHTNPARVMEHINLARWAEHILIIPASANSIAKLANGFADNLLMATILASSVSPIIVPAMNQQMWKNSFTQRNIAILKEAGIEFWGPQFGLQACGDNDIGRMLEPDEIYDNFKCLLSSKISNAAAKTGSLNGLTMIITAGATVEDIDPVRYISNHSSGRMGYALAEAAIYYGAKVILISGKADIDPPHGLFKFIVAKATNDMLSSAKEQAATCDIFIGCAAICDYRVASYSPQKIKKNEQQLTLNLIPNPDIISQIKSTYPDLFVIGFAAETENIINNAIAKLKKKKLDMIIANDVSGNRAFGTDMNQVTIINKKLNQTATDYTDKKNLAYLILEIIADNLLNQHD